LGKAGFVAGDTIRVQVGTYTSTGNEVVRLNKNVTLSGGWNSNFSTQNGMSTIDGQDTRRGIMVNNGVTATVEHFNVQNGLANLTLDGGGIYNSGNLTLTDSFVVSNTAGQAGFSGGGGGGGIYNSNTMTLYNSSVSDNTILGGFDGGGIHNIGQVTLNNSIINGNSASNGGGIYNSNTITLYNSTVNNNTSGFGGGIRNNFGTVNLNNSTVNDNNVGGIYNQLGTLSMNNSTISGNNGGGIYNELGTLSINSSTISGNNKGFAGSGDTGGIENNSGTIMLQNSILAMNTNDVGASDCRGSIVSSGYNLIGSTANCNFTPTSGDLTNVDPKLDPLEGSPGYHPLLFGSPAIDAGNPSGCMGSAGLLTTDQRGKPRFGSCDIGAYEAQSITFSTKTANQSTASPGDMITYTITLTNGGATNLTNVNVTDTLPIFLTYINNSLSATSGSYNFNSGTITWNGDVNAGGGVDITFAASVTPAIGPIINAAVISGGGELITRTTAVEVEGELCNLTKAPGNPVLAAGIGGSWDEDDVWRPMVLKEGNSYNMWYVADDGSNPPQIGLATSSDGLAWNKSGGNPVLSPGGGWEAGGLSGGSVISDSGQYKMWYSGYDSSGVGRIGYATSPDGINWTKYGSNPVLDVGSAGSWEDADVFLPSVVKQGSTYHMWYEAYDGATPRLGHATSSDGLTWSKDPANPVLDVGPSGDWDWLGSYGPNVIEYNNTFILWYSGHTLPEAWQTGYALSTDGTNWTRQEMLIPEGTAGAFDSNSADYASVIADGGDFKVWYSGYNGADYTIGYATAEVCSEASPAPSPAATVYLPVVMKGGGSSCPAYYTDNFSDPGSGWPISDTGERQFAYTGGQYRIWVKNPSAGWFVTPGAKATDFTASVSARRASGSSGAYAIQFGINEDWSQFYEFTIGVNSYSIWRFNSGTWTPLRNWTFSNAIATGTNWNRLKVIRQGSTVSVYVNNQFLTTVTDGSFTGLRRIGLAAYSPSNSGLDARFDNFSLYPASCGPNAADVGFEMGKPEIHHAPAPFDQDKLSE